MTAPQGPADPVPAAVHVTFYSSVFADGIKLRILRWEVILDPGGALSATTCLVRGGHRAEVGRCWFQGWVTWPQAWDAGSPHNLQQGRKTPVSSLWREGDPADTLVVAQEAPILDSWPAELGERKLPLFWGQRGVLCYSGPWRPTLGDLSPWSWPAGVGSDGLVATLGSLKDVSPLTPTGRCSRPFHRLGVRDAP